MPSTTFGGSIIFPFSSKNNSSSSFGSTNTPQLRKHNTYRTFSLAILVLFFEIKLPARLNTHLEGADVAGIARKSWAILVIIEKSKTLL